MRVFWSLNIFGYPISDPLLK